MSAYAQVLDRPNAPTLILQTLDAKACVIHRADIPVPGGEINSERIILRAQYIP